MNIPKYLLFVLPAIAIFFCTGYRPSESEHSVGYSEKLLGDKTFMVRYNGAGTVSEQSLRKRLLRRADELCGKNKYSATDFSTDTATVHGGPYVEYRYVIAKITCVNE